MERFKDSLVVGVVVALFIWVHVAAAECDVERLFLGAGIYAVLILALGGFLNLLGVK